jgi:ADP-ribosylation factor GTPase-activating protein 1
VEGGPASGGSGASRDVPLDASKKDFWDSFAEAGSTRSNNASVGTSAIKKAGGGGPGKKEGDDWDKW